ncbi:MAG TPA: hypothetical protein VIK01_07325 [Polyangiaceae bacterium]
MTNLGVFMAIFWALVPIAVFVTLRSDAERPAWWLALDIPAATALDLVAIVLVSRLLILDVAVWVVKGAWLVLGASVFWFRWRRGWRPKWPAELPLAAVLQALLLGVIALLLSLLMTRPCAIWDRQFHVPGLTSMRGQVWPFYTVYEPWKILHYHYGGNLLAVTLQATSFGILHASLALSLVHNICSFWFGVTLTFLLRRLGLKHTTLLALVLLTMLFASPVVPLEGEHRTWFAGYSTPNWMSLSLRPHMTLAVLTTLPFLAFPLVRLADLQHEIGWRGLLLPLVCCVPLMLIVDEFSMGILGLGLAGVWLKYPQAFAPTRRQGLYFFLGLGLALVFGICVMNGTVSPGAPHYPLNLVFPRSPGFYTAPHRLDTAEGIRYFFSDLLPILAVLAGGFWLLVRNRHPLLIGSLGLFTIITVVSVFLFTTLNYSGSGLQNHRFIIVPMYFCPLFLAAWLVPRPGMNLSYAGIPELGMVLAVFMGAASGVDWLGGVANNDCRVGDISLDFYDTNCRADVGASVVTEKTRPMYFDPAIQYLYIGCRPAFMVGPQRSMDGHDLKVGKARLGIEALRELASEPRFQSPSENITVACARGASSDKACRLLQHTQGACRAAGTKVELCTMTPEQLKSVLR